MDRCGATGAVHASGAHFFDRDASNSLCFLANCFASVTLSSTLFTQIWLVVSFL